MKSILKKASSYLLVFVMIFSLMPQLAAPASAAGPYEEQIDVATLDMGEKRITEDGTYRLYGTYNNGYHGSNSKWIIVADGVTATFDLDEVTLVGSISPFQIEGTGKATLNLIGDNTLTCNGSALSSGSRQSGIQVLPNAELIINGTDSDSLTASAGYYSAAIGGYYTISDEGRHSGKITINGGVVTANGSKGYYGTYGGAGIGGAYYGGNGGEITINGGTVIATASYSAGIGGGNGGNSGTITINGGTVTSTVDIYGAGIGNGYGGSGGNIIINDGTVKATGGSNGAGIGGSGSTVTIDGGTVNVTGGSLAAGIGGGSGADGSTVTITGGVVTTTGGNGGAGIGGGFYANGGTITIDGGVVNATSGSSAAGIGGGQSNTGSYYYSSGCGGDITINGGVVTATATDYGAGIGGGGAANTGGTTNGGASGGNITITGGVVTATGGTSFNYGGAGIGGGCSIYRGNGNGGNINISGGVVTATGGGSSYYASAGIGGGYVGDGGTVTITGGIVKATSSAVGIGASNSTGINIFTSGNIEARKTDGTITVTKDTTTTNGAEYGLKQVYCVTVTVVDADGKPVPDAEVTIPENRDGPYTYTAVTDSGGIAYCWVPARTGVSFEAEHEELGFGYAEKDVAANNTNAVTIVLGMRATVTKTPSERVLKANAASTPVTLNVKAENVASLGDILGATWFRVSAADTTIYTKSNFETGYDAAAVDNKGDMTEQAGGASDLRNYSMHVGKNGTYWVQVEFLDGLETLRYQVKSVVIDNIYENQPMGIRGAASGTSPVHYLYGTASAYEPLEGDYGIPYDLDGTTVLESPSLGFYQAVLEDKGQYDYYWNPTVKGVTPPITLTLDGSFLTNSLCDGGDVSKYTLDYEKVSGMWQDIAIEFVDKNGDPVTVDEQTGGTVSVPINASGDCVDFLSAGAWYEPPRDGSNSPIAYMVGSSFNKDDIINCNDFSAFDPKITGVANSKIYIVYAGSMINVTEHYQTVDGSDLLNGVTTAIDPSEGEDYFRIARMFNGYVPVGYKVEGLEGYGEWYFDFDSSGLKPDASQQGLVRLEIPNDKLTNDFTVTYYYKAALGGIPADEAVILDINRYGNYADGTYTSLGTTLQVTRKGKEIIITNDGSPSGNPAHIMPASITAKWIFDNKKPESGGGNEIRTIVPTGDMEVNFYYDYDTRGDGIPDKEQYVTELYVFDITGGTIRPSSKSYVLNGGNYSKTAPIISGYVAYGYIIDSGEMIPFERGADKVVAFTTTQDKHEVTFVYKTAAEPVTIKWVVVSLAGGEYTLASMVLNGYVGEEVTVLPGDAPDFIPADLKIDDATTTVPSPVKLGSEPIEYIFYYREDANYATITITGESTDGKIKFTYQQTRKLDEGMLTVTAWSIPAYKVTGYEVYDRFDNVIASGDGDTVEIDLSWGNQTVRFTYMSTVTTVIIQAVETGNPDNVLLTQVVTDAVVGQRFSWPAPYIDNTWVLIGEVSQVIDVMEGTNIITFAYEKASGNVTVLLKENDTDGPIIRVMSETVSQGETKEIEIPDLLYYTKLSETPYEIDYTGAEPYPVLVEYYYEKDMMDVTIRAVDAADGEVLKTEEYPAAARKGEAYVAIAPAQVKGYTLAELNHKSVYADPDAPGGIITIDFEYKADDIGDITVTCYYLGEGGDTVILGQYTVNAIVGSKFTAVAGYFEGFALKDEADREQEIEVKDTNTVEFEYTDERLTVTIMTKLGSSDASVYGTAEKVALGTAKTVYAPYVNGYVLKGYTINGGAEVTVEPLNVVVLSMVTENTTVTFRYVKIEDNLDEYTSAITVKGVEGATTHYEYTLTVAKNAEAFDIAAQALSGLKVVKAELDGVDKGAVTTVSVDPADGGQTLVFTYASNMTTVTIEAVYNGTTIPIEVFTPVLVPAEVGKQFSYAAPVIEGFTYIGAEPSGGVITSVSDGGTSKIVFSYKKNTAVNGLIINAVDQSGNTPLATVNRPINNGETFTPSGTNDPKTIENLAALNNYEFVSASPESVTYDGVNDVTVTYTYKRIQRNVIIEAWDSQAGTIIGSLAAEQYNVGQTHTLSAPTQASIPALASYTLNTAISTAEQGVYVENATGDITVKFWYKPNEPGSVKVTAYWLDGDTEREIQSYINPHAAGIPVTITAPTLHGWILAPTGPDNESPQTVTPTASTTTEIKFRYVKNVSVITVKLMVGLTDITDRADAGYATSIEVPKGDAYTVYAPYINGYVLAGSEASVKEVTSVQTAAGDVEVTFTYRTVDEASDENYVSITIKGVSEAVEHYSYVMRVLKSDTAITLVYPDDVFNVPGYVLADGQDAKFSVEPNANKTVTFDYAALATTVKVKMVNENDDTEIAESFLVPATTGGAISYNAPYVPAFYLTGAAIIVVDPVLANGASEITFNYKPITSSVTIVCKEDDTNGRIIKIAEIDSPAVGTNEYDVPDLSGDFYTAKAEKVSVTYDGSNAAAVEAYYTKDLVDIPLLAVDYQTGGSLTATPDKLENQRKGEVVAVSAPGVENYVLVGQGSVMTVADGSAVTFKYRTLAEDEVAVKAVTGDGTILQSYVMTGTVGETIYAKAPAILGWKPVGAVSLSAKIGEDKEMVFLYEKNVVTITISLVDEDGDALSLAGFENTVEVANGGDCKIYAPHIAGYVIDGEQSRSFSNITTDESVTFRYKTIASVVPEHTVVITVIGKHTGGELYRYEVIKPKNFGALEINAFNVSGYMLLSETPAIVEIEETAMTVVFNYESMATTVTIHMKDGSGEKVANSYNMAATVGSIFTCNAPNVAGYYLIGSGIGTVTSVLPDGDSEITFEYEKITSSITIVAKEDDADGRVIRVVQVENPEEGLAEYDVPDLRDDYYIALMDTVMIDYDGINSVSAEAYYTKELVDVEVRKTDDLTGIDIEAPDTLTDRRRGEAVMISAPNVANYMLVSAASQTVIADIGAEAVFHYRTLEEDEVAVKAVTIGGTILQSYVMTGRVGETVYAKAPSILGWRLVSADNLSAKVGVDKEMIFKYEKNVVTITIRLVDEDGDALSLAGFANTVEVANGGDYTVYAPHIAGYELISAQKLTYSAIQTDQTATFIYRLIERGTPERDTSSIPGVNPVLEGDEVISGTGTPGAEIEVTLPSGDVLTTVVDGEGNWEIDITEVEEGERITVVQKEEGKNPSSEIIIEVGPAEILEPEKSETPVVNPIIETDTWVSGTGIPDAEITVILPNGQEFTTTVNGNGDWEIEIPEQAAGSIVTVIQTEDGKDPSGEVLVEVSGLDQSETPIVYPVTEGDTTVSGLGTPEAEITVTLPGGYEATATVDDSGRWTVHIPPASAGDILTVTQTEDGKDPSGVVVIEVGRKPESGAITVTVTDASTGKAISGAKVVVTHNSNTESYTTDNRGKVVITDTEQGTYTIVASYSGYNPGTTTVTLSADNASQTVVFALGKSGSGSGGNSGSGGGGNSGGSGSNSGKDKDTASTATLVVQGIDEKAGNVIYEQRSSETVGAKITVSAPDIKDYTLSESSNESERITIESRGNKVVFYYNTAVETMHHEKYLNGYEDGTIRPDKAITRAEVAVIIFRIIESSDKNITQSNRFTDVNSNAWYAQAVNYLASNGILFGYEDGTFRPERNITRAELVAMVARLEKLSSAYGAAFADVASDHWAAGYIGAMYVKGWIEGYPDGSFKPENPVSRAETVKIINKMLNRSIEQNYIPPYAAQYTDIGRSHWAYFDIIEASTAHDYIRNYNGYEKWD